MEYAVLGPTGVEVSRICLGTATFGVAPRADEAEEVVHAALDAGITFFDTANVYGTLSVFDQSGAAADREPAEVILGRALEGRRDEVVLATKSGERRLGPGAGLSRRHIVQQVEHSLRRLRTDYIDVYYAHFPDPHTPLEQTLLAYDDTGWQRFSGPGFSDAELEVGREVERLSREWGGRPHEVSRAWLLSRQAVASAIVGAETPAEITANAAATDIVLEQEQLDTLTALSTR
ncbi:aldo/keto reductase [Streptomyces millisiae]|uniref:Aldo/keto reductase n=1 Tax=Streptomyces millisiae TaxID=3075542 RepID=A0ABU2LHM1_9ACTN|nr:aldo/keto reductase [Streptomyces sp. DSM 44918]MDT0317084.1 aldo/keto reductase [Streptomyces sp. DSM 44918]